MKRIDTFALLLAAAILQACAAGDMDSPGYGTIHFSMEDCAGTRSNTSAEAYETAIHSLQVIVADSDGKIESCRELGDRASCDIPAKPGDKTVLAVANGPSFQDCISISQVLGTGIELTRWNSIADGFVMSGRKQCRVAVDSVSSLGMKLTRYVSRVRFASVTSRLPAQYGKLTLTGVMLSNAAGNQTISGDEAVMTWHNAGGRADEGRMPAILGEKLDQDMRVNTSYALDTRMYCYPNATATDTRAVLSVKIQGEDYYYPISIPHIERNTSYDITLSIYHPGSTDPDIPVSPGYIKVEIKAGQWDEGPGITENL